MKIDQLLEAEDKPKWKTRSVEAALKNGYNEISDFMSGKLNIKGFADFISNMAMSQTENSREARVKSNLETAARHIYKHLKKEGKYSEEELDDLMDAIEELEES
jgi:nucleoside-specific outer membrane channel protein Tsx